MIQIKKTGIFCAGKNAKPSQTCKTPLINQTKKDNIIFWPIQVCPMPAKHEASGLK